MKVTLVFDSRYGQTRNISHFIAKCYTRSADSENDVNLIDLKAEDKSEHFLNAEVILVGSPIYMGRVSKRILNWCSQYKSKFDGKTLGFFTVSLNAADKRPGARTAESELLNRFIRKAGVVPLYVASFAGALNYTQYGWLKKNVLKRISLSAGGPTDTRHDFELTDWDQVRSFAEDVINKRSHSNFAVHHYFPQEKVWDQMVSRFTKSWVRTATVYRSPQTVFETLEKNISGKVLYRNQPSELIVKISQDLFAAFFMSQIPSLPHTRLSLEIRSRDDNSKRNNIFYYFNLLRDFFRRLRWYRFMDRLVRETETNSPRISIAEDI